MSFQQGLSGLNASSKNLEVIGNNVANANTYGAKSSGMHSFEWDAGEADNTSGLTFRVTATGGSTSLTSTALMRDTVTAVRSSGDQLLLDLTKSGGVAYGDIKAFN